MLQNQMIWWQKELSKWSVDQMTYVVHKSVQMSEQLFLEFLALFWALNTVWALTEISAGKNKNMYRDTMSAFTPGHSTDLDVQLSSITKYKS